MKLPFRELVRNRRGGVSVVIATIMSITVFLALFQNIFIWDQLLRSEDQDRLNEKIAIDFLGFGIEGNFELKVRNIGTIQAHIIAVWINDTRHEVDYYLDAGQLEKVDVDPLGLDPFSVFPVTIFTERGNSDSATYSLITDPDLPGGYWDVSETGVFKVEWFYCKYSSDQTSGVPIDAGVISKTNTYVAFYVKITNNWVYPCKILDESFLTMTSVPMLDKQSNFYIVKEVDYAAPSHPVISEGYDSSDLTYGVADRDESLILTFAAQEVGGSGDTEKDWKWGDPHPFISWGMEGTGIQISVFFKVLGLTYGQTLSTQALVLVPS